MQEIVLSNNTIMANHNNLTFQLNWFFLSISIYTLPMV